MRITVLGTGTSQGVPIIGCDCAACTSTDEKDKRLRTSIYIEEKDTQLLIDIGPDFRQQMLRAKKTDLSAILLTHEHNDHMIGLDDVRPLNFRHQKNISVYARISVLEDLKHRFAYIFDEKPYPGAPQIELHSIENQPFFIKDLKITPIETLHGRLPVFGYRIGAFTYLTDAKYFEKSELQKLEGTQLLILSALHHKEHHAHLNLKEAVALAERLNIPKVYLTHISHRMGLTQEVEKTLPAHIHLAYDGLVFEVE